MKRLATALMFVSALAAQEGPAVVPSQGPPVYPYTTRATYDVNGNLTILCKARSNQSAYDYIRAAQLTSLVVATNVATITTTIAHGLAVNNMLTVGGSGTAALNSAYRVASVPSATTFTIATSGVPDGTYSDMKILMTDAPRGNALVWAVAIFTYNTNNQMIASQWVNGISGASQSCDAAATSRAQ